MAKKKARKPAPSKTRLAAKPASKKSPKKVAQQSARPQRKTSRSKPKAAKKPVRTVAAKPATRRANVARKPKAAAGKAGRPGSGRKVSPARKVTATANRSARAKTPAIRAKIVAKPAPATVVPAVAKAVPAIVVPAVAKAVPAIVVPAGLAPPSSRSRPKRPPTLDRPRKTVAEVHGLPSSLDAGSMSSAARSGRADLQHRIRQHNSSSPALTGGDVDADWASADSTGDEAPGGDNPTPDQDVVEEIGRALGVEYADDEELQGGEEIADRDRHRWELDPNSKDDFDEKD